MSAAVPLDGDEAYVEPETLGLLKRRVPGQSVMEELLDGHGARDRRGLLARVLGVRPLSPGSLPWYWGALGERAVGRTLASLGPEWTVLHAVPVGEKSSDIDHVVIGPTGVFTINTKRHPGQNAWTAKGTFMVAGTRYPYVRNSEHEAARAGKLLSAAVLQSVPASAAIVVVGARQVTVKEKHRSVAVLRQDQLLRWITRRPVVYSEQQVALLSAAAAQPSTWRRSAPVLRDPADVVEPFEALHRLVEQARRRRIGWLLAVPATFFASAAGILPF
ncbi:nuclease-related domain-containing protein [Arthrobacter burdickii]|uniref:Nuclease-related domain-containing protein n=1 Tax=Arthrobacter burdickii TaxID=3035920 RepID=A0ABT8K5B7_9MICC|nr:nuclease-related domain-containing protein [Arthrobacter burdickii]MDN4612357.1 nuclease-related domain-containing protein [Arthrobacter burdickii]